MIDNVINVLGIIMYFACIVMSASLTSGGLFYYYHAKEQDSDFPMKKGFEFGFLLTAILGGIILIALIVRGILIIAEIWYL